MCLHPVLTNQLQSILSFKSKSLIRGMHNIKLSNPEGTLWFIHTQSGFLLWRRACWFAAGALRANVEKTILICIQGCKNCVTSRRFSSVQTSFIFFVPLSCSWFRDLSSDHGHAGPADVLHRDAILVRNTDVYVYFKLCHLTFILLLFSINLFISLCVSLIPFFLFLVCVLLFFLNTFCGCCWSLRTRFVHRYCWSYDK